MIILNENNFDKTVSECRKPLAVDFYAEWCAPCRSFARIFSACAEEETDTVFAKVNIDGSEELAKRYGIMTVPTVILFNGGNAVASQSGVMSRQQLLSLLHSAK